MSYPSRSSIGLSNPRRVLAGVHSNSNGGCIPINSKYAMVCQIPGMLFIEVQRTSSILTLCSQITSSRVAAQARCANSRSDQKFRTKSKYVRKATDTDSQLVLE